MTPQNNIKVTYPPIVHSMGVYSPFHFQKWAPLSTKHLIYTMNPFFHSITVKQTGPNCSFFTINSR